MCVWTAPRWRFIPLQAKLLFTYICWCAALTDAIRNTISGSCLNPCIRSCWRCQRPPFCQPHYLHVSKPLWSVFVLGRRGGDEKQYPKLTSVLFVGLFWNQTVIFIVYTKRRHCYINPLASWTFRLATVVTVNCQVLIMFSVLQEQGNTTACFSNDIQTLVLHWILCVFVFRLMSMTCMHCGAPGLIWYQISAFRLLTFPVWTNCRCLSISWVNIKVIWKLSQWRPFEQWSHRFV